MTKPKELEDSSSQDQACSSTNAPSFRAIKQEPIDAEDVESESRTDWKSEYAKVCGEKIALKAKYTCLEETHAAVENANRILRDSYYELERKN